MDKEIIAEFKRLRTLCWAYLAVGLFVGVCIGVMTMQGVVEQLVTMLIK